MAKCSYFLEFQDNQIWKEAFKDVKLNDFNAASGKTQSH